MLTARQNIRASKLIRERKKKNLESPCEAVIVPMHSSSAKLRTECNWNREPVNMAAKSDRVGEKRKSSSANPSGSKTSTKKPRLESTRKPFGSGSDVSDVEDGGAKLAIHKKKLSDGDGKQFDKSTKANGDAAPGKAFERGNYSTSRTPKTQLQSPLITSSGANSRESHAKQRQLAQDRKAAKPRPHAAHRIG